MELRKILSCDIPTALLEIPQPPKELWVLGELPSPETVLLTVVGSRKFTSYGKEACEEIIQGLAGYDIAIVSGLAIGMDAIAHESAMRAGLHTIAVPGSGLDENVLYPRTNVNLARRILEAGGALLSEFPPDQKATNWTFPKRNRIMAGLAKATLIIESGERSGTRITAKLATDFNREVLAVPGSIFSPTSRGPNLLIELGATPILGANDVLRALGFALSEEPIQQNFDFSSLPPTERGIMELLTEPMYRDQIIEQLDLPASDANILLMKMEIAGLVKETPTGIRRA